MQMYAHHLWILTLSKNIHVSTYKSHGSGSKNDGSLKYELSLRRFVIFRLDSIFSVFLTL